MANETVRSVWEEFARAVMPPDAPPVQWQETRRAFMAGFWAMLQVARGLRRPGVNESDGAELLRRWEDELRQFQEAVRDGHA